MFEIQKNTQNIIISYIDTSNTHMARVVGQRDLFKAFKSKGLSLSVDANSYLLRVIHNEDEQFEALDKVLDEIQKRIEKQESW